MDTLTGSQFIRVKSQVLMGTDDLQSFELVV